jgi:SNF2 family DNA or RNA helicase
MDLYPHQPAAVAFLKERKRCCLADDQGLGKTISVAVAARELGIVSMAIVAPSVALWNWQRELKQWHGIDACVVASSDDVPEQTPACVITSHALLLKDHVRKALGRRGLLVVDESHQFCRRNTKQESQRARVLYTKVVPKMARVWCLTGTPASNNASELWSMLHHLMPETFTESFRAFRERYCRLKPTMYGDGWKPDANKNLPELKQRMSGFILRRLKKDVLSLPAKRVETLSVRPVTMPPGLTELAQRLQRRVYGAKGEAKAEAIAALDDVVSADTPAEAFAAMMAHEDLSRFRRLSGIAKVQPALELIESEFDAGLDCIVLFAQHTAVIDALRVGLAKHRPVVVDGRVAAADRTKAVDAFQAGRANVFIGQIQAAGTAITLTRACEALFVELSYVPGDNAQAADRIYRIGQTRPCRVRFLSLAHSIDEIIVKVVREKVAMIQELMS